MGYGYTVIPEGLMEKDSAAVRHLNYNRKIFDIVKQKK